MLFNMTDTITDLYVAYENLKDYENTNNTEGLSIFFLCLFVLTYERILCYRSCAEILEKKQRNNK